MDENRNSKSAAGYLDFYRNLSERVEKAPTPVYNPQEHNDKTRSTIALYFVKGFFWILGLSLFFIPIYNIFGKIYGIEVISLKDILLAISGIVSGPLGFVIGHYFKFETSKRS